MSLPAVPISCRYRAGDQNAHHQSGDVQTEIALSQDRNTEGNFEDVPSIPV